MYVFNEKHLKENEWDSHGENYLKTREGKYQPVEHCIANSGGWQFIEELEATKQKSGWATYKKDTFGCVQLVMI